MKNKQSFSLVEMLVVISIIGVLSVSIIINKESNQDRTDLLNTAKDMALSIREAQNRTMSSALESGNIPCGYGVGVNYLRQESASSYVNSYEIFYEKMSAAGSECDTNKRIESPNNFDEIQVVRELKNISGKIEIGDIKVDEISIIENPSEDLYLGESSVFFAPPDPTIYIEGEMGKTLEIELRIKNKTCPSYYCKSVKVNQLGQINIE